MARQLSLSRRGKGHSLFVIEPKICFTRDENIIKHELHHRLRSYGKKHNVTINNGLKGPPLRCGATLPRPDIEIFHFALCLQHK